ncbi:MAG: VanW family protein [Oscillospiraceae bacterium]
MKRETERKHLAPKRKKRGNGGKIAVIVCVCVVALLLAGAAGFGVYVSGSDTIYPKVSVNGTDVGGMTAAEAASALEAAGWGEGEKTVTVELPLEHTLTVNAADVGAELTAQEAADRAFDYCHGGTIIENVMAYVRCLVSGAEVEIKAEVDEAALADIVREEVTQVKSGLMTSGVEIKGDTLEVVKGASAVEIDESELMSLVKTALEDMKYGPLDYEVEVNASVELDIDELYNSICCEAKDAYYDKEKKEVVESVTGVDFNKAEAQKLWDAAELGETVEIPLELTEPERTTEYVESRLFADDLGETVTTSLAGSTQNRITNVQLAAASIDGIILAPGEQFSYNDALGERTTERGYKAAGAYSGGQVVQEVGGGICQVSSTLYYAALLANLQIDVRTCHYFPVGYLPAGLDATVSWGGPEFKFTNNRDWPIKIEASVDTAKNTVSVHIVGTDEDGSYVQMTYATWLVYGNSEYPETATGYKAATYRSVFDKNGNLLSKELEAYSEYHYHEEDIVYPTPTEPPIEPTDPVFPPEDPSYPTDPAVPSGDPGYYFDN